MPTLTNNSVFHIENLRATYQYKKLLLVKIKLSTFLFMQKRFGIKLLLNAVYLFKLSATRYRSTLNNTEAGGLHSTEVEFLLLTQQLLV